MRATKFATLLAIGAAGTTQDVTAGGLTFHVKKTTAMTATEAGGPTGCTDTRTSPEALRLTVSVTWDGMNRQPVRVDSLMASPAGTASNKGNYVVVVQNRDGAGVPGVAIALTGGPSTGLSGTTDSEGCLRFTDVLAGTYQLTGTKANYVTRTHAAQVTDPSVTVEANTTGGSSYEFDNGGAIKVRFVQGNAPTTPATVIPGARFFGEALTVNATWNSATAVATSPGLLWPSTSQYEIYADTCTTTTPMATWAVQRNAVNPAQVDVKVPMLTATATNLPSSYKSTGRVRLTSPCGTPYAAELVNSLSTTSFSQTVAVPPGTLQQLCFYYQRNSTTWAWKLWSSPSVAATDLTPKTFAFGDVSTFVKTGTQAQVCT